MGKEKQLLAISIKQWRRPMKSFNKKESKYDDVTNGLYLEFFHSNLKLEYDLEVPMGRMITSRGWRQVKLWL